MYSPNDQHDRWWFLYHGAAEAFVPWVGKCFITQRSVETVSCILAGAADWNPQLFAETVEADSINIKRKLGTPVYCYDARGILR